jgi:methyl-accepting chemotaxis protein
MMAFLAMACIALIVGVIGSVQARRLSGDSRKMYEKMAVPLGELAHISVSFQRMRVNVRDALAAETAHDRSEALDMVTKLTTDITTAADAFEKKIISEEGRKLFAEFGDARRTYHGEIDKIVALAKAGNMAGAEKVVKGEGKEAAIREQALLDSLMTSKLNQALLTSQQNESIATITVWGVMAVALIAAVLSFGLGLVISRSIVRPIRQLSETAGRLATGDLRVDIECQGRDEVADLSTSFRRMTVNLTHALKEIDSTSHDVSSAAGQLEASSEHIATGSAEAASQAGGIATAGEEMSTTAIEIAHNCHSAALRSAEATKVATSGAEVVARTVQVMGSIALRVERASEAVDALGKKSDEISTIVSTIEDIADQTNLLALNAAIEAARAGDQGRGFAVVADEVRKLAERTTQATKEIGVTIRSMQEGTKAAVDSMTQGVREVRTGTSEADMSGQALKEILSHIESVSMEMAQVATAAEQQTATTDEIYNNIQRITVAVNQSAKAAHESAGASSRLADMAKNLQGLTEKFRF